MAVVTQVYDNGPETLGAADDLLVGWYGANSAIRIASEHVERLVEAEPGDRWRSGNLGPVAVQGAADSL